MTEMRDLENGNLLGASCAMNAVSQMPAPLDRGCIFLHTGGKNGNFMIFRKSVLIKETMRVCVRPVRKFFVLRSSHFTSK